MGVTKLFRSPRMKRISALSMLVEAALALVRGKKRLAALLVGAAVITYRWSALGVLAQIAIRLYRWRR